MAGPNLAQRYSSNRGATKLSRRDTAIYSRDLLKGLKIIALGQQQHRLAELLDAAVAEADRLVSEKPPGR